MKFADDVIAYEISDQFDLSGIQDKNSDQVSEQFVLELKQQLIPFLVEEIKKANLQVQVQPSLDPAAFEKEIKSLLISFEDKMKSLQPIFKKHMFEIVDQINEENWKYYLAEFEEKNEEILKEKRKSRLNANLERFLGRLTAEQIQLVKEFEEQNQFDVKLRVANRIATINRFKQELGPTFSKEKLKEISDKWLSSPSSFGDPATQAFYIQRREALVSLVAKVLHKRSEKQTKHLIGELSKMEQDLSESLPQKIVL